MKKRILAMFLACMMIFSVIAVPAFAEEECTHKNKTYTSIEAGKDVPASCTEDPVVCSWVCNAEGCGATGYERVTGAHSLKSGVIDATCTEPEKAGEYCENCDYVGVTVVVGNSVALGHDWQIDTEDDDYQAPTCDKPGKGSLYCTRCDATKTASTIASSGHSWAMVDVVDATCAHAAGIKYECVVCDAEKVDEFTNDSDLYAPALGHSEKAVADKKATCAEEGYTGRTVCEICGEVINEGTIIPKDTTTHTKKLVDTLKEATCTANGVGKYECADCGADLGYISIPKSHKWGEGVETTPATCGKDGVMTFTCTVSGCKTNNKPTTKTEVIKASGKHVIEKNKVIAADCLNNERIAEQYCSVCKTAWNVVDVPEGDEALGHSPVNKIDCTVGSDGKIGGKAPVLPSCHSKGWGYVACERCGVNLKGSKTSAVELPTTAHKLGDYKHYEADCVNAAGVRAYCTNAGCTYFHLVAYTDAGVAAPAKGHTEEAVKDVVATCAATGLTGKTKCKVCGVTIKAGTVVPKNPNNHANVVVEVLKAPTCTTTGVSKYTCSTKECASYLEYKATDATHTWDAGVVTTQPNCGTKKVTKYTCTALIDGKACGATKTVTGSTSGEHSWVQNTPVAATCTRAEGKATVCFTCNTEKDFVATSGKKPLGHNYVNYIDCVADNTTTPDADDKDGKIDGKVPAYPTCTADGWGYIKCSRCGEAKANGGSAKDPIVLPKIAHKWGTGYHIDASCIDAAGIRQDCTYECGNYKVTPYTTPELAEAAKGHTIVTLPDLEPTCMLRGYKNRQQCSVCKEITKHGTIAPNPDNHVYVLVDVLKPATCTTVGVGQYACKNPACADKGTEYFGSIAASHDWDTEKVVASENSLAVYNPCKNCDAVKVVEYLGEDDLDAVGKIVPGVKIEATVSVTGKVILDKLTNSVVLTVSVKDVNAGYEGIWLEVNGKKVTNYTKVGNDYTFVCRVNANNIASEFNFVVKSNTYGVLCKSETASYKFDRYEGEYSFTGTDAVENEDATAEFVKKGVLIGDTVRLAFITNAEVGSTIVLTKKGANVVFATATITENPMVTFDLTAADWDQEFAVCIKDAEGNVISDTIYYSVAQYANGKIGGEGILAETLSAMMQAIAE